MSTENFDAETGTPLYALGLASWNILADMMYEELNADRCMLEPLYE